MVEIKDNFLDKNQLLLLKNIIVEKNYDIDFPWRIRYGTTPEASDYYFTYNFYNNYKICSEYFLPNIVPILDKMNAVSLVQARANMFVSKLFTKSGFHIDYDFDCKTSILYLNSCNGGTEFKINNKIKFIQAKENRLITFKKIEHRAVTSTDCPIRFILNFNYF